MIILILSLGFSFLWFEIFGFLNGKLRKVIRVVKGKSILILVIALAASYPIVTGDFRLIGLKYKMLAFAEIAAERAEGIGKQIYQYIDGAQPQSTKEAKANDGDEVQISQDN